MRRYLAEKPIVFKDIPVGKTFCFNYEYKQQLAFENNKIYWQQFPQLIEYKKDSDNTYSFNRVLINNSPKTNNKKHKIRGYTYKETEIVLCELKS